MHSEASQERAIRSYKESWRRSVQGLRVSPREYANIADIITRRSERIVTLVDDLIEVAEDYSVRRKVKGNPQEGD